MQTIIAEEAENVIGTKACPACILCGGVGTAIHRERSDRIFGATGSWTFKRCADPLCGLIWLDPMPLAEEIGKAYANYYTHANRDGGRGGRLKQLYLQMKRAYWAGKYNYPAQQGAFPPKLLGKLMYLFPLRRSTADDEVRLLPAIPGGRLLDVGCGTGEWLAVMRALGWEVAGLDFDEGAVKVARENGLDVGCGALEQQNFPDNRFDAVVLNHVIEHVPDPIGTMAECRRILKPGGKLAVFTPNGSSLSHKVFKGDWRGLEPPRHLHIFSTESLPSLLQRAGFRNFSIRPRIARSVIYESTLLRRGWKGSFPTTRRDRRANLIARLFNLWELCALNWDPSAADCVAAIAVKS